MASQGDSKGLKFVNVASLFSFLKGSPIYAACMRLEATINDKKKIYIDKVGALMSVLENVLTDYLSQTSPEQILLLFEFLHRHTLNLVLHGDWGKNKSAKVHMSVTFKRFESIANRKKLNKVSAKIRSLIELLTDPWGNPTLTKILNGEQCTDEEVLQLIQAEMGLVLIVRLEVMAEARCDAQALRLIEICLQCVHSLDNRDLFQSFTEEIIYIRDIYLILLVRAKNNLQVISEVTKMGVGEAVALVRRCTRGERLTRLRKARVKMADVVANMALASAMIRPVTEEVELQDLIEEWYNLYPNTQVLIRLLRNLILNAVSSHHIYLLGKLLVKRYGEIQKTQCIELYIRALTVNLNELQKYKSNYEQEKVKESEVQLSEGFLLLADYLGEDIITCRECVLTAFSLNPTSHCYQRIRDLAVASGKLSPCRQDDNCENNQSSINCDKRTIENQEHGLKIDTGQVTGGEQLTAPEGKEKTLTDVPANILTDEHGKVLESEAPHSAISISDAQKLGIPQTMCDDLSTVISSARYQVLSWQLEWAELSARCEAYIRTGKEVRSTEKELKYLNIDYNLFKDWPKEREYSSGIEKGFEEFIESESDGGLSEPFDRVDSKHSHDEGTQDSLEFSIKIPKTIKTSTFSSSGSEYESSGSRKKIRGKRKALSSIIGSETGANEIRTKKERKIQNSVHSNDLIINKQYQIPIKLQFSDPPDLLDLVSIEEDADEHFSPIPGSLYPVPRPTSSKPPNGEKSTYCIVENDLSLSNSLSPFNSPSKLSDPSVLKSLRMYRTKKPITESVSTMPDKGKEINSKFTPALSNINLHPRMLNRSISKPSDVLKIDVDVEPEVIDLVDDEDDIDISNIISKPVQQLPFDLGRQIKMDLERKERLSQYIESLRKKGTPLDFVSESKLYTEINLQHLDAIVRSGLLPPRVVREYLESSSLMRSDMLRPPPSSTTVLVDDEDDINMNNISSKTVRPIPLPFDLGSQIRMDLERHSQHRDSLLKKGILSPAAMSEFARNAGLITLDMIRPPHSSTTVQVVQVSNSGRPLVTPNNNTVPACNVTVIQTQTTGSGLVQAQASPSTTVMYSVPPPRTTTTAADKPTPTRSAAASAAMSASSNVVIGSQVRSFFTTAPRQVFTQSDRVFLRHEGPERMILNPPVRSPTATVNVRRSTPSPREVVMTSTENTNVPIGVIRVERIALVPSSESNQSLPNLSPIKAPGVRPQVGCVSRQVYMRSGVSRAQTITSTAVSSSSGSPVGVGRSMPVTAHIQRVGYPPAAPSSESTTTNQVQMKYILSTGTSDDKLTTDEGESTLNSQLVLSAEQIQQLLPRSTLRKEKLPPPGQDDNSSSQGASLPKFQQAFGRTMYQNSATGSSATITSSNEPPSLNFTQQMQPSASSADSVTSGSMCSVLSKAVQTTNKESEMTNKLSTQSNEHNNHHKISLPGSTSTSTIQAVAVSSSNSQGDSQSTSSIKGRSSDKSQGMAQTPVKIFCKGPVTLAGSNLLQGKSVAILKTTVASDKLTQAQVKYEVDNKAKETVIRSSNMNALLAAALQPHLRPVAGTSTSTGVATQVHLKPATEGDKKNQDQMQTHSKAPPPKNYKRLPIVQNQPVARYTKPLVQVSAGASSQNVATSTPVVTIPIRTVLATGQQGNAVRLGTERIEVRSEALVSSTLPDDPSGSSLDQQLKEFESVFNKVIKTSQMKERTNSSTVQIQPHLNLGQQILLAQPSVSSSTANVEFSSASTNQTCLFQSTSTSTIHDLHGERVSLTFISQPTSGATNTLIAGTNQKITSATPVVVVQSCSKPVASPALSVSSQNSSSPAPPSTPGSSSSKITTSAIVKQNSKNNKTKTATKTAPTTTLKVSTLPKPQQKPQEDEQTTQRIYAILDKYAEQLRNSPELKNKPAPRRRSNPPTNPNQNSKRKKSTQTKSKLPSQASCSSSGMEMSPGSEDMRTIGSEDSSNGHLSQTLNSPQSRQDDPSTPTGGDISSETSESLDSRDTRIQSRVVLTETSTGQSRTVIVQDGVSNQVLNVDASKLITGKSVVVGSQTIVPQLVLPNVPGVQKMQLFPVPADGRPLVVTKVPKMYRVHQVTMPRGTSGSVPILPGTVVVRQMCGAPGVKQVKMPTSSSISTQSISSVIPSGSHSFTLAHDTALEPGDTINLNLDNAILLNSTPSQSISFVHRSIPSSYQSHDSTNSAITVTAATQVQKTTVAYSTADLNVSYIKQESGNVLSMCSPINVIPVSSAGENKPGSSLECITIDDDVKYTASDPQPHPASHTHDQSSGEKHWTTEPFKPPTSGNAKKEETPDEYCGFQSSVKSMMSHRTSNPSSLLPKQDHFMDIKKAEVKEEHESNKPERVLAEPELCDEGSVSSDSAGSGRVKRAGDEASAWPYSVAKIECIVKPESPTTAMAAKQQSEALNQPTGYKKKVNNVENTIYQMAFKRSDRNKVTSKELERNAAALERDLRLQKSLSEECEDLGVDEPSTSDLFPEAELLLDPDHSSRDSQLDLPGETFSQTLHSSSSCDSREMSPMFSSGKRPTTYRGTQKIQSTVNKSSRFVPIFTPVYQFTEESTSGTVSSTRDDSPDSQVVSYRLKGNKLCSNSDSNSPFMTKSLGIKGNVSPCVLVQQKTLSHDQHKSSSSGVSTPINGGESTSPHHDEMLNSCTSEECAQKTSDYNCKDTEVDTTDSDSNIDALNVASSQDTSASMSPVLKSAFTPMPNPAANAPFTYGGNRSGLKVTSRKEKVKHEIWKNILKGCDNKEDLDSDMSDQDHIRISDKRSTSTEEDLPSEGESLTKNGLGTESEETQSASNRIMRSTKTTRKRPIPGSLLKCSSPKSKIARRVEPSSTQPQLQSQSQSECVDELMSMDCQNTTSHGHRRSSLRGHINKKNCPCCNGSQDKQKPPSKILPKNEKLSSVSSPSSSSLVLGTTKKKPNNKSPVKSSHITKKR